MAKIKIYGDIDSASVFFVNSTVEPKAMGTIEASVKSDEDRIVIKRTDRFDPDGVNFRTIFRRLNPSRVQNRDGQNLVGELNYTTQQVVDYINEQANLQGVTGGDSTGTDLIGLDVCFKLDATSTSIMMSNGFEFGVNTIKAVADSGVVQIKSMLGDRTHFTNLEVGRACKGEDDTVIPGGLNDVVNYLNELFTVGAFEQVVITDPEATTIADYEGLTDNGQFLGVDALDPITDDLWQSTDSGTNDAGYLSENTIDQAGEYFTFDIRGKGTYMFGLVHTEDSFNNGRYTGNQIYADPSNFCTNTGNAAYGYQWALGFHIGNAHASWTLYGAATGYKMGEAWINSNTDFDEKENWNNNQPVKMKVGLDENGYISVYTKADEAGEWKLHARSSYAAQENAEYKLGIKLMSNNSRIRTQPKVHLLEPEAPTMYFRYIESPDGVFNYPLFATQEEANYYHEIIAGLNAGEGQSHTHVYVDDPTGTTWYMPENGQMNGIGAPYNMVFNGQTVLFTEITSLSNSDLVPPTFSGYDLTVNELASVNYQTQPQDTAYLTAINNLPVGLMSLGGTIIGTAPEVTGDNVANPSDTYTVEVVRTNSYGSSVGTFNIIVNNLTVPVTVPSGFTLTSGNMADSDTLDSNSVLTLDDTLASGKRMIVSKSWVETNVLPNITSSLQKAYVGVPSPNAVWGQVELHNDFDAVMRWEGQSSNAHKSTLADGSDIIARGENSVGSTTNAYYNYAIQWDGTDLVVMADTDASKLANTYDYTQMQRYSAYENYAEQSGALPLVFATKSGGQMDVTMTGITFSDIPSAPVTRLTNWSKAIDFSGSSERAMQVSSNSNYMPIAMDGLSATASAPTTSGNTSGHVYSRPWATAIVFKADGNNSNQHIWNQGEGTGSSDDNIYLRLDANQNLYFGWGRSGSLSECRIATSISTAHWYAVSIAYSGHRYGTGGSTAGNLYQMFDIRLMSSHNGTWDSITDVGTYNDWNSNASTTNGRMDRQVLAELTIGGRGGNRSFHGKIASFVVTTLKQGQAMPTDAEHQMMITDPKRWMNDYKVGETYRRPTYSTNSSNWQIANTASYHEPSNSTQVWLMGDGTNDSYSNMIRNQVNPSDQNATKLNLLSMVSNDIQSVNINGLT